MLTITKLKMWKDPGYTRQCVEVPPVGSKKLPIADYESSEPLRPRRGALLNAVELPLSYLEVHDMSYLYMEISDGQETPNTMSVFGWILSVSETASANEAVVINWTPDYWRTYSDSAVFGKGTITRCPNDTYKRPFLTQPRMWTVKSVLDNPFSVTMKTGFILMVSEMTGDDTTGFAYYWGILDDVDSQNNTRTPTTREVYSGVIDEVLGNGIIPSSIVGGWVVPSIASTFTVFADFQNMSNVYQGDTVTFVKSTKIKDDPKLTNRPTTGLTGYGSDDMKMCVAVDPYGNVCGTLPWGYSFASDYVDMIFDLSCEGLSIYYKDHAISTEKAIAEGKFFVFNGLPIPVNSNAWSEYAFTYQRSYDKRMAEIQRNQRAVSGISSVGSSIVGGAIAGSTKGVAGGIAGAVSGGVLSTIGTAVDFLTAPLFNDEIQTETDKLVSNQTSNMLIAGGGLGWKEIMGNWKIVQLEADATSLAEYTAKISNDGYTVEIPVGTPTAFLTAGGPLQIQNLVVTGSIPPEAKTYIKNILSNGVRIVENNPSGVVP